MDHGGYGGTDSNAYGVQAGHENAWRGLQIKENGGSLMTQQGLYSFKRWQEPLPGADDHHREIQTQG